VFHYTGVVDDDGAKPNVHDLLAAVGQKIEQLRVRLPVRVGVVQEEEATDVDPVAPVRWRRDLPAGSGTSIKRCKDEQPRWLRTLRPVGRTYQGLAEAVQDGPPVAMRHVGGRLWFVQGELPTVAERRVSAFTPWGGTRQGDAPG